MNIVVYTHGCCLVNPGPGGYAAIVITQSGSYDRIGKLSMTTIPRVHMFSAIEALKSVNIEAEITIISDYKLLVDAFTNKWIENWKKRNWRKPDKKPVANADLWKELDRLVSKHNVSFQFISGNSVNGNYLDVCHLAMQAYHEACHPDEADYVI